MLARNQFQQPVESLRVRFYRAYLDGATSPQTAPVPIGSWLQSAERLLFDRQPSRYHEIGDGRRVYTLTDQLQSPTRFRLNRTTYQGVPPKEWLGNIDTNYLTPGQGLMDTWYSTVFDHVTANEQLTIVAIATKGNIALNTMLRDYVQNKCPIGVAQLKIEQLAHKNILNRINTMREGSYFEISVKPAFVESLRAADTSMADAMQASQNVYEQSELSQIIKPVSTGRFGLRERFQNVIDLALANEHRTAVTKLRIGGLFGTSNRTTIINLLSSDLSVEIDVPVTDPVFHILDSNAVYDAIQSAYMSMADAISEATEVSIWQGRASGTAGTSSESTPRQPPLLP